MEERVRKNSANAINRKVDGDIKASIADYKEQTKKVISNRIKELDKEWDIERALEVNMPVVALTGLTLSVFVNRRWAVFPAAVLLFFVQHAVQGWCPPLPIFRKLGFRTRKEIERERYALKFLRGDYDRLLGKDEIKPTDVYKAVSKD